MRKNNKGFTLIEILAVIVILGIIMLIAIPNVSKNIADSRKAAYVTSIQKYIESARQEVQTYSIKANNQNAAYYIPTICLGTENGDTSPYGDMMESYVVVTYDTNGHYEYYYTGRDDTNHGMELTKSDDVNESNIRDDVFDIDVTKKVGGRDLSIVYSSSCDGTTTRYGSETSIICGRTSGESTGWTYADRTITIECVGNCKQTMVSKTFDTTTQKGNITITDTDGRTKDCPVDVYVDKSKPTVTLSPESGGSGQSYKFTKSSVNPPSGYKIMYCIDNTNTCKPDIEVQSGVKVQDLKNVIGNYYLRYAIYTGAGYYGSNVPDKLGVYTAVLSPYLKDTINNEQKKITLQVQGNGTSGAKIYYCIGNDTSCVPTDHGNGNSATITVTGNQCIKYYMKKGGAQTLEKSYCFW